MFPSMTFGQFAKDPQMHRNSLPTPGRYTCALIYSVARFVPSVRPDNETRLVIEALRAELLGMT